MILFKSKKISLVVFLTLLTISTGNARAGMFFSNKSYSNFIDTKLFVMNNEQVSMAFRMDHDSIVQDPDINLKDRDLYLVVLVKNTGNQRSWGVLKCSIEGREVGIINMPGMGPNMKRYKILVAPLPAGILIPKIKGDFVINSEWDELYAK